MRRLRVPALGDSVPRSVRAVGPGIILVLFLAAVLPAPAAAQKIGVSRLEFVNQSVKVKSQSAVAGFGFRIHMAGGDLNKGFVIMPAFQYWRDLDRIDALGVQEIMQRDWTVELEARYRIGSDESWTPYVGGGFGMHMIRSVVDVVPPGAPAVHQENSSTKFAPSLAAGIDFPAAGPIRNAIELQYDFVPDLEQFKINFGIGWAFGPKSDQ